MDIDGQDETLSIVTERDTRRLSRYPREESPQKQRERRITCWLFVFVLCARHHHELLLVDMDDSSLSLPAGRPRPSTRSFSFQSHQRECANLWTSRLDSSGMRRCGHLRTCIKSRIHERGLCCRLLVEAGVLLLTHSLVRSSPLWHTLTAGLADSVACFVALHSPQSHQHVLRL